MTKSSLIEGNIVSALVKFTIPILLALALQVTYSSVDILIVGNFGSIQDVSGVGTGSQLMVTLTALCSGLATGVTILLGQMVGRNNKGSYPSIIVNSVYIFLGLSLVSSVLFLVFIENLVEVLNTPIEAIQNTKDYIFYSSLGIPMIFFYNLLGSIFRGFGNSKTPLMSVGIACVINIFLDLLFVGVYKMGAGGAAIATIIAQACSVVIIIIYAFINYKEQLREYKIRWKIDKSRIKEIFKLGVPISIQSGINSASFLLIAVIINKFGVEYSAGVSLAEKLSSLILLIPLSFMQSLSVFVAQNYGANQLDRAKQGLKYSYIISVSFGIVIAIITFIYGDVLVGLFSDSKSVINLGHEYLKAYCLDVLVVPMYFCFTGYFNGYGKTMFVMIQSLAGGILMRVPLFYIFSLIEPTSLFRMGLAIGLTTIIQDIICVIYYKKITSKDRN